MNGAIVAHREPSSWQRLLGAREGHRGLELLQRLRGRQAGLVLQDVAVGVAVQIALCLVHTRRNDQFLPYFAESVARRCSGVALRSRWSSASKRAEGAILSTADTRAKAPRPSTNAPVLASRFPVAVEVEGRLFFMFVRIA